MKQQLITNNMKTEITLLELLVYTVFIAGLAITMFHYSNIRAEEAKRASETYEACIYKQTGLMPWRYYQERGYYPTCELSQGENN
jgi:hypothetical protein